MTPSFPIHADCISVGYDNKVILRDLTFRAEAGALTVLIGPNGCGKSTLLKAIARVLPLKAGQVMLDQQNVHLTPTRKMAQTLAFLPQGPVAPEGLSVRELVAQGRFPHQSLLRQWSHEDARVVEKALAQTNLSDLADRPLMDLSGGQRQRAWIAMVLAQDTPAILLDEPTAFLDLKIQVDLLALLRTIAHEENRTVVVVLHDLNIAASFADRMVMLRNGAVHADGPVHKVFTSANLEAVFDLESSILTDPRTRRPVCVPHCASLALQAGEA
ncbi:MAG: ABC transporter ATP-binding protein [Cohaesibacter sp.]|nr:ABC transporter ATP-binding protein [Cohaesibacter sp.]